MGQSNRECWGDSSIPEVTDFALGRETHDLEPCADWESFIEGQLDEGAHLSWAGIMPNPRDDLGGHGILEVEPLNKG